MLLRGTCHVYSNKQLFTIYCCAVAHLPHYVLLYSSVFCGTRPFFRSTAALTAAAVTLRSSYCFHPETDVHTSRFVFYGNYIQVFIYVVRHGTRAHCITTRAVLYECLYRSRCLHVGSAACLLLLSCTRTYQVLVRIQQQPLFFFTSIAVVLLLQIYYSLHQSSQVQQQ